MMGFRKKHSGADGTSVCHFQKGWILLLSSLMLAACATRTQITGKDSTLNTTPPPSSVETITTSEAISLIASLEQDPLSEDAPARRMVLTAWVMASPDVGELVPDDTYIGDLFSSDHPYSSELFMQYMFGMARAQTDRSAPHGQAYAIEAGIRSMLAAYKSFVAADESLRDHFLDELDHLRQLGKLSSYIEEVNRQKRGGK